MKFLLVAFLMAGVASGGVIQMPSTCTNPDGMAVDPQGRLVIAAPNCDRKQPGAVFRLDAPGGTPVKWFDVPPLAESGYSQPMGVCFGPEGELYVCDCQKKGFGRVLRFTFKDDRVASCETVAEGLHNANGVKYLNGKLYVTQAFLFDVPRGDGAATSGLYMFNASDRNVRVGNTPADRECVFCDVTRNPKNSCGLNGVAVTSKGEIYTGNYGDGRVWKLTTGADGRIVKAVEVVHQEAGVVTPDGLCVDAEDNCYIADMFGRQSVKISPDGTVTVLKKDGFNRPSEPCVWRGNLYISNYGGTTVDEMPLKK
ncbi:MAG: SMP-30/gluconolactonase/LRE family protein [Kiritimatiellae bacterium]|nr:SMP-30/gluconolactonase/LRE family protein [Kiritimatiellia bacterium]